MFDRSIFNNINLKSSNLEIQNLDYLRKLLHSKTEIVQIDVKSNMTHDYEAENNELLKLTFNSINSIEVYNQKFNKKKLIQFVNKRLTGDVITFSDQNIYILDNLNGAIIKTDFEFNEISAINKIDSIDNYKLKEIYTIYYKQNYLYITFPSNKTIVILTSDLKYSGKINVDCQPYSICLTSNASNNTICVGDFYSSITCFYKKTTTNDIILKYKYYLHGGSVSEINSFFYEFLNKSSMLCYNSHGLLIFKLCLNELNVGIKAKMIFFNNIFMIYDATKSADKLLANKYVLK